MKTARLHACNVLNVGPDVAQLWQFDVSRGQIELAADQTSKPDAPLPTRLISKTWRSLFQHKVNLAWLPPEQVFLRVIQLPTTDPAEVASMLELQLEKLSPMPVAQIVWSYEPMPVRADSPGGSLTVIVIIAARSVVEEFLGRLETQGYLADRVELPFLHELVTTRFDGDGIWIYASPSGRRNFCLMAWWYSGMLHNLTLLHVIEGQDWTSVVQEKVSQIAWTGEIEGWLTSPPRFTLVADASTAALWEPVLRQLSETSVQEVASLKGSELAALSAERVARAESKANLLPPEFVARYKQQFFDRLWMRGLGALGLIYLAGLLIYFASLQVVGYQNGQVESQVVGISGSFTNALRLKARTQVLQEQSNLRFAALDSWRAITETLAPELTLTSVTFQRGRNLTLTGTASEGSQVTDYMEALNKVTGNSGPLFAKVNLRNSQSRSGPRGPQTLWNIECELQRQETP